MWPSAGPRLAYIFPIAAGFFWLSESVRRYPRGFFWPPDPPVLVVQIGILLVFVAIAAAVAAGLQAVARFAAFPYGVAEPLAGGPRLAAFLVGVTLLAAVLRFFWIDLIPSAPWTDVIYAIEASARTGRFLAPWEFTWVHPHDLHPESRVTIYGDYADYVRAILLVARDRIVAHALVPGIPAALLPAALALAARRLVGGAVPAVAALLAAAMCWPLVLSRWGWEQQLMSLLLLLGLERLLHGWATERALSFALAGFLGGVACHTYLGGYLGLASFLSFAALASFWRRKAGPFAFTAAGSLAAFLPLVPMYASHPELWGGRAAEIAVRGSLGKKAADLAMNVYEYLGMFYFNLDPHYWHGLYHEPHFTPLTIGFMTIGLAWLFACGLYRRREWLAFWLLLLATLAGGVLSQPQLSPNGYRTGFAGLLMLVPIATGIVALTRSPVFSIRFRRLALPLTVLLVLTLDFDRFLAWGLGQGGHPSSGESEAYAGRFLDVTKHAGQSAVLDPGVIYWVEYSPYCVAFQVDRDRPLEPLHPPEVRHIAPGDLAREAKLDWYVTTAPAPGYHAVNVGSPRGGPYAIRLRRPAASP
ncbi:MAG TPA: hypothetical protein VGR00_11795 [Thermoanaerobaculia bacterium]|nr:hypothetical protein [Thermoanaerobaculia bacterium]